VGCFFANPQSKARGRRIGDGTVRESVGEFLSRPFIVTFPLYLYAFQRYCRFCVLQHATFTHLTSSLPKCPHVPLGMDGFPFEL